MQCSCAVESLPKRQRLRSIGTWYMGPAGGDGLHDVAAAAVRAHRQAAADDLAQRRQVGRDAEVLLHAQRSFRFGSTYRNPWFSNVEGDSPLHLETLSPATPQSTPACLEINGTISRGGRRAIQRHPLPDCSHAARSPSIGLCIAENAATGCRAEATRR